MSRPVVAVGLLSGLLALPGSAVLGIRNATAAPASVTGSTTRANVATGGAQAKAAFDYGSGVDPAINADGRYVAFASNASNLVADDTNEAMDIFVRDRAVGSTTRVSLNSSESQANDASYGPDISPDGRYVAFISTASNLVTGDTNAASDVFVRDRLTGNTSRASLSTAGTQANGDSNEPSISADGRYVAFTSEATNLVSRDTNTTSDVFVRDRVTGTTTRISTATGGTQAGSGASNDPQLSADGRYVSFISSATDLVSGDTNAVQDVFVRDRLNGTTTRDSVSTSGAQADNFSGRQDISGDGRYVAFASRATNLVAGDTNGTDDVFVRDRLNGTTTRASLSSAGSQASGGSGDPQINADGRYVTFTSIATDLAPGDVENADQAVFVRDRLTGSTTRTSVSTAGTPANRTSTQAKISGDGRYVAFTSLAGNLVAGDTNYTDDVFVRDQHASVPTTRFGDFTGNGWSDLIVRQTTTGDLLLYSGNGVTFPSRTRIGTGWNSMTAITRLGDFNRDGHEDVIARDSAGSLWLYPGTGSGFTSRVRIGLSGWNTMREITAAGDLTGDGYPDLLAVQASTGYLYLYPGHGTSLTTRRLIGPGWNAMSELTATGDFNRDGHPDLAARATATGVLWLYPGTGTGFGARRIIGSHGWNTMRALVSIGDFDRDGYVDLLAVQTATGKLMLYPGHGTWLGAALQIGTGWTSTYAPLM